MVPKGKRSGSEPRQGIRPRSAKQKLRSQSEKTNLKREKSPSREPSNMPKNKIVIAMNKLFDVSSKNNYEQIKSDDNLFKFYDNSKTKDSDVKQPVLGPVNAYIVKDDPDILFAVEAKPLDSNLNKTTIMGLVKDALTDSNGVFEDILNKKQPVNNNVTKLNDAEIDTIITKLASDYNFLNSLKGELIQRSVEKSEEELLLLANNFTEQIKDNISASSDAINKQVNIATNTYNNAIHQLTTVASKQQKNNTALTESNGKMLKALDDAKSRIANVNSQLTHSDTNLVKIKELEEKILMGDHTNLLKHQLETKIEAAFKDRLFENKINELEGKIKQNNSSTENPDVLAEANTKLESATEQLTQANKVNKKLDSLQSNLQKQKLEEAVQHAFENKYLHQRIDTVNDKIKSEATEAAAAAVKTEISSYTEKLKELEAQLKELNTQKYNTPSSPTSVSQNDLKSQLENAIQRELERAHLQRQIDDLKTSYNNAVTKNNDGIQEYIKKETDTLNELKGQLEKQLKELNENKNPETTSSNALTEQSMKEKLENAIQSELNRAHLQKQIEDLKREINKKQGNVGPDSTATTKKESTEYASKEELKTLSDKVVKNQLEQAIKDAFTTQLILQSTQNNDKSDYGSESRRGNKTSSLFNSLNKKPEYSPFRDAEFIYNMYDVIWLSEIYEENGYDNYDDYVYKIKDDNNLQIVINHNHDYYDDYYNKYNNIVYMKNKNVYKKYASTENSILRVVEPYENEGSPPTYHLEKLIPKFATAEEFQRFKLEHAILHAFESKLKQITKPEEKNERIETDTATPEAPGASTIPGASTSVTKGNIEYVDGSTPGTKNTRYTIHTNLDDNKELTVGSIEEPFKDDVANKLNGVTDIGDAETKIENLLKTKYKGNKKLNELLNNLTVTIK